MQEAILKPPFSVLFGEEGYSIARLRWGIGCDAVVCSSSCQIAQMARMRSVSTPASLLLPLFLRAVGLVGVFVFALALSLDSRCLIRILRFQRAAASLAFIWAQGNPLVQIMASPSFSLKSL